VPKRIYKLNDFSGGINNLQDPADIQDNEVQDAKNVMFNVYGGIQAPYVMTNSSNNKISAYNNDEITTVQPGYGLGYFETDYTRDSVTVAQTSSIAGDDDSEGSATGFIARLNGGLLRELEYKVSGTQQNLASSFPIGTLVSMTATSFPANGIDRSAEGIYRVVDTNSNNIVFDRAMPIAIESPPQVFWGATLKGVSLGDRVILLADPAAHNIDIFSTSANSYVHDSNGIVLRDSVTSIPSKVKYYKGEESIRCCDTSDKNDCKIQWYGWVQRRHFNGANNTSESNSYMNYFSKDNNLAPPEDGSVSSTTSATGSLASFEKNQATGSSSAASLDAGKGFNIAITTETDEDGLIESGVYEFAQTFIYDENQESLLYKYSQTHTVSEENEFKALSINIAAVGKFEERISGGRIYIRKQGDDSEYIMLLDVHLGKGCRTKFSDDYTSWNNDTISFTATTNSNTLLTSVSNTTHIVAGQTLSGTGIPDGTTITVANQDSSQITMSASASASSSGVSIVASGAFYVCPDRTVANNFRVRELGFITYEVINGFSSSIFSNALGDQGEYWKDSVIANNRVFVCNVTMKDENTGNTKAESTLKPYPDRIMYSMPNRYDTFPSDNFIEASKGDADVYVAIQSYADRLLAYKNNSLDIINISGNDVNWFLEESRQYQGVSHPEAVKKTQYGVVWANEQGLYLYNGSSLVNLKEKKIRDATWANFITSTTGIIYDQQESMVFIIKSLDNKGDAYMYDLKKGNFTYIEDFVLETNDGLTNSVDTDDNNVLIGHDSGSSIDIYKLNRLVVSTQPNIEFQTKDLDFGDPAQVKKIYSVIITYKASGALTDKFTLEESDGTSHALSGTISASASNWSVVKLTPSSPVVCNKVSVRLDTGTDARGVYVNDIGVEFRSIYRKGV